MTLSAEIDGIMFSNALIIDDTLEDVKAIKEDFEKRKISVSIATTFEEAEAILNLKPELNIVILDWYLKADSEINAVKVLALLKDHVFTPVVIYTDKGESGPKEYISKYNLGKIVTVRKKSVKGEEIFKEISNWLNGNPELKVFLRWAREVERGLNETLWTVHDLEVDGLKALFQLLEKRPDHYHSSKEKDLVDFLGRILNKKLGKDAILLQNVKNDVKAILALPEITPDLEKLKKFHRVERYKETSSDALWTGAILKDTKGEFFVVATPTCDISNSKVEQIILLEAECLSKYRENKQMSGSKTQTDKARNIIKNEEECIHFLPYAAGLSDGLICRFDRIQTVKRDYIKKSLDNKQLVCVELIDSPFVENLTQRMTSYLMRLGVRDLGDTEIEDILSKTIPPQTASTPQPKPVVTPQTASPAPTS